MPRQPDPLKLELYRRNIKQFDAAPEAGIHHVTLNKMLNGTCKMSAVVRTRLQDLIAQHDAAVAA